MGTAKCVHRNCPVRHMSRQRRQSAGEISSTPPVGPAMPALFTSASSPPIVVFISLKNAATCASSDTSATVATSAPSSDAAASSARASTSQMAIRAPCCASARAMQMPMPPAPAVMATRRPARPDSFVHLQVHLVGIITAGCQCLDHVGGPSLPIIRSVAHREVYVIGRVLRLGRSGNHGRNASCARQEFSIHVSSH